MFPSYLDPRAVRQDPGPLPFTWVGEERTLQARAYALLFSLSQIQQDACHCSLAALPVTVQGHTTYVQTNVGLDGYWL